MVDWNFKALRPADDHDGLELVDLLKEQSQRVNQYKVALRKANSSDVARPIFSKYFVKGSVGSGSTYNVATGNVEYGFCQSLHGEEFAVAAFLSHFGRKRMGGEVLGLIAGSPGNIATPCGNCRDILLDNFGPDLEIVSGAAEGGVAVVAKLSQYLCDAFESIGMDEADTMISVMEKAEAALKSGEALANDAYSPADVHPERKYCALVVTKHSEYLGAHDVMCDYHPIYALRDAVRQARRAHDASVRLVIVVGRGQADRPPHVMYKDRQHLMELCVQGGLIEGLQADAPVYLVSVDKERVYQSVWRTSVKQWLPFPFSPRNFGPEFIEKLTAYYRKLG